MNHRFAAIFATLVMATAPSVHAAGSPELKISYAIAVQSTGAEPAAATDLWQRVRGGFQLPESDPKLTQVHERWFTQHSSYVQRAVERSKPYLYHIVDEVEKRKMPMEIALLPMIESAFNPTALSPMKASGIWQFIPSTGRLYGLDQNGWYDGRRDITEATRAALDYLEKLHGMFGDWELALAAYNCGEGCVGRALKRSDGKGYTDIKLPNETRNYVPKLIAVRNIIRDPARYGLALDALPNEPYFLPIALKRPIEARTAARLAEMSLDELMALNPGFQRRVIHTDTRSVLLLPADRVETFQFNLHRQGMEKGTLQTYAAKKGESVAGIAAKYNVTVDWLKEHNPITALRGKFIRAQDLIVPKAVAAPTPPANKAASANAAPTVGPRVHVVRKGETLFQLARQYRVSVAAIEQLNALTGSIKPGMKLEIPLTAG